MGYKVFTIFFHMYIENVYSLQISKIEVTLKFWPIILPFKN